MSLIKCHECGHDVSTEADSCPNCGLRLARRPASGKLRKRVIITIVIILIVALVSILYRQHTLSPEYSLWQAKKAVEQHDVISFEKYVDVEGVSNSLIDQVISMRKEETQPQHESEQLGESIAKGLVMLLKPHLSKMASEQMVKYVETGKFEEVEKSPQSGEPNISLSSIWEKSGKEENAFKGVEYVKKEGKIAYIGLKFFQKNYNTSLILVLKMRDKGGYWQVAEINNFADFMKKLDDLETKRENLIQAARDGQIGKAMDLIKEGTEVNSKDTTGNTALIWEAWYGHTETVKALIDAKADVNAKDKKGYTALEYAAEKGYTETVSLLKTAGAK